MQFVEVSWPRFLAGVDDVEQHRCFRRRSQGLGLERELAVGIGVARLEESVEQRARIIVSLDPRAFDRVAKAGGVLEARRVDDGGDRSAVVRDLADLVDAGGAATRTHQTEIATAEQGLKQ